MRKNENRFKELENLLESECGKCDNDCKSCPYVKECEEYKKLYGANKQPKRSEMTVSRGMVSQL